ncbi:MAG: hypothetical protein JSU85_03560 [Candidatus Zixiibacteriota bacterium]|nr:MAG: hypothetical protein JSU85_03560 [candidate division Zixibacteria bacterium]
MKERILKIMAVFVAGILIFSIAGCGAKPPTTANDLTEGEQQKLIVSTEIVTVAEDTEMTVD